STEFCSHCNWVKEAFDETVKLYSNEITAYHWQLDVQDNLLTPEFEGIIPENEIKLFTALTPQGSVPAFFFGCKYYRIGNGFESQNNLKSEVAEFKAVIEELIKETEGK
ncbi:MAG: hypothetical protein JW703_02395, partial [Candidatus Diapherotrites archaeon]|nr:hypothetical protein [Candidatus Diapherotrites archaeon]